MPCPLQCGWPNAYLVQGNQEESCDGGATDLAGVQAQELRGCDEAYERNYLNSHTSFVSFISCARSNAVPGQGSLWEGGVDKK